VITWLPKNQGLHDNICNLKFKNFFTILSVQLIKILLKNDKNKNTAEKQTYEYCFQ
jgi:hypothetical protein